MKKIVLLVGLICGFSMLFGQEKLEREYRVKPEEVPKIALNFIEELPFTRKIKWYREEGLEGHTFEAKTRHRSRKYSIEFNDQGQLEDIEIEVELETLPPLVTEAMTQYLETKYDQHRIRKIQLQLTGVDSLLQRVVQEGTDLEFSPMQYEVVVKVQKEGLHQLKELLFDAQGQLLRESLIILKNADHLEY